MTNPFDAMRANMMRLGMHMEPQKRSTSLPMRPFDKRPVTLLVGPLSLPIQYTKSGVPRKHQPKPLMTGDRAYVGLGVDGLLRIYPFSMAGSGWELIEDAQEGVHFEFS